MSIPVIVTGAAGRMGGTLARLVREAKDMTLVGAVEREEMLSKIEALDCPVSSDVRVLLGSQPTATILDFTAPVASLATANAVAEAGASMVIGTTGLNAEEKAVLEKVAGRVRIFWSPNMSVGVNVLLKILPELTKLLGETYDVEMTEIHHNKKKDAPSGTALRLAESLAGARQWPLDECACYCRQGIIGARPHREIGIQALRGGDVVGVHTVYFMGPGERIELTHQAHSRENFANGALRAVRWLQGMQPGRLYGMQDIF